MIYEAIAEHQLQTYENLGVMGQFLVFDRRNYDANGLSDGSRIFRTLFPILAISITQEVRFPDISFYQGNPNFDTMRTQTANVIIRAGQNNWVDPEFGRNYSEAKRVGMRRGVYWFYDDRVSPQSQAQYLIALIKNDKPELGAWADWENSYSGPYGGLKNVVTFMQLVEAGTGVTMGIYTGYYWFRDHSSASVNPNEYAYLANKPLWEAWYTSNPAYVQVPAPWSALTLWQYGTPALGSQFGVQSGNIDMNWYNGSAAKFEATYPPAGGSTAPIDETKVTHVGVTWSKLIRYGCTVYVQTFDLTKVRLTVHVGWSKVSDAVRNGGAIVGFNGGGWYEGSSISNVVLVSEGLAIQPNPLDGRPFIAFDKGTTKSWFAEGAKPPLADVWNAWGFDRFIGRDGVYNSAITDNTDDARTCWGVTADGKLIALVADGRLSGSPGLSFPEVWAIMNGEFNCVTVGNGDGGDSSTGVDTMLSANPYSVPGEGFENLVLDQVLFYPKEGLPPMAYRYDAVSSLNQMSLRTDHSTLFPRIASYPVNTIVYGNDLFTADKDLYNTAGVLYQKVGDVWLHVLEINGQPVDGWMAIVHMGQRLMVLTDHGVATSWPSYYILENPDGVRQRYNKA